MARFHVHRSAARTSEPVLFEDCATREEADEVADRASRHFPEDGFSIVAIEVRDAPVTPAPAKPKAKSKPRKGR